MTIDPKKLTPLGDKVVLKMDDAKTQTKGGIHLAYTNAERSPEATVVRLGTGWPEGDYPWQVQQDDRVLLEKFGGQDLGEGYVIVKESDILAFLPTEDSIVPVNRRIVVRMLPPDEKKGLLWLPEGSKQTQEFGVVVGVSDDCEIIDNGDYVFVSRTQGTHYRVGGDDFILLLEDKVQAKFKKDSASL